MNQVEEEVYGLGVAVGVAVRDRQSQTGGVEAVGGGVNVSDQQRLIVLPGGFVVAALAECVGQSQAGLRSQSGVFDAVAGPAEGIGGATEKAPVVQVHRQIYPRAVGVLATGKGDIQPVEGLAGFVGPPQKQEYAARQQQGVPGLIGCRYARGDFGQQPLRALPVAGGKTELGEAIAAGLGLGMRGVVLQESPVDPRGLGQ